MTRVEFARALAVHVHGNQMYGVLPYSAHLDDVVELVTPFGEAAQIIGYLHDAVEDAGLLPSTIGNLFAPQIQACVEAITDGPGDTRAERKAKTYEALSKISENSLIALALVVKAADRLANVRMSVKNRNERLLKMYREEQSQFAKVVHRSGLNTALIAEASFLLNQ